MEREQPRTGRALPRAGRADAPAVGTRQATERLTHAAEQAALAAEFIGRTAEAWRRRALAAEAKNIAVERDRAAAIARLSELMQILRPDVDRDESGHCGCCYRARRALTAQDAEVVPLRAAESAGGGRNGPRHRPERS